MDGRPETPYTETEALLAVMRALDARGEGEMPDYTEVKAKLAEFLPGELASLALAANELRRLIWRDYGINREITRFGQVAA
jgi:hypothetical protein